LSKKDRARQGVVVEVVVVGKEKLGQGRSRDWQEILRREPCKLLYDEKVTPDIRPYAACSYAHFLRSGSKPPENYGNESKICKMVDPLRYCGGEKELVKFLETLRSNFASHKQLFPTGDPDQAKYAVSFLDTWNNHPDLTQRQTENMDPAEWGISVFG
jgi:hypothetical protein